MEKAEEYPLMNMSVEFPEPELFFTIDTNRIQTDKEITYLHLHDCTEIGYCYDGGGIFMVENKVFPFHSGDVVFIAPDVGHLARSAAHSNSHWAWLYIDFKKILPQSEILADLVGEKFQNIINVPIISRLVRLVIEIYDSPSPQRVLKLHSLLQYLAAELVELPIVEATGHVTDLEALNRIQRAINFFGNHYAEKLSLPRIAARCGLSVSHFRRLFLAATGMTPQQYLNHLRISMAQAELAKDDRAVSEVALSCGFPSLSSFNRQFLKHTGIAPSHWRSRKLSLDATRDRSDRLTATY